MIVMWPLFFGLLIALMVTSLASFELLIYRLFTQHPVDWQRAGEPMGLGQSGIRSGAGIARYKLGKQILFQTPNWVRGDTVAKVFLVVHRASLLLFLAGAVGFPIVTLLLS